MSTLEYAEWHARLFCLLREQHPACTVSLESSGGTCLAVVVKCPDGHVVAATSESLARYVSADAWECGDANEYLYADEDEDNTPEAAAIGAHPWIVGDGQEPEKADDVPLDRTPGLFAVEWDFSEHADRVLVVDEQGVTVATCWKQPLDPPEWVKGNVVLFAAAPVLLAAAKRGLFVAESVANLHGDAYAAEVATELRAAIAQAEGRA